MTKKGCFNRLAAGCLITVILSANLPMHTDAVSSGNEDSSITESGTTADIRDNGDESEKPAIRAVKYQVFDKRGKQIGKDRAITGIEEYSKTGILLPKATSYIKITEIRADRLKDGKIAIMSSGGYSYQKLDRIPRASFEQGIAKLMITLTPDNETSALTYEFDFEIPDTQLTDMNDAITVQDGNGFIPPKTVLAATAIEEGNQYDKVKKTLALYGGNAFQVYDVRLKNEAKQPVTLDTGETINLTIQRSDIFSPEKDVKLYYAEFTDDGMANLTEFACEQTKEEVRTLTDKTGYYVIADVNNVPQVPAIGDAIPYLKNRHLKDILLPDPESGVWTWAEDTIEPSVGMNAYEAVYQSKEEYGNLTYRAYVRLDIVKTVSEIHNLEASPVNYGTRLSASVLSGNAVCNGEEVKGRLEWKVDDIYPECTNNEYDVLFVPEDSDHYAVVTVKAGLQVFPKAITVKIDDQVREYGDENPKFTFTLAEGFLAGQDTKESLDMNIHCEADETTGVGQADITGESGTANYKVAIQPGVLTIEKRPVDLRVKDVTAEYGSQLPQYEIEAKSGLMENDTLEGAGVTGTAVAEGFEGDQPSWGTYDLVITSSDAEESSNYEIGDTDKGKLTVTPVKARTENHSDIEYIDAVGITVAGDFTGEEKLTINSQTDKKILVALKSKVKMKEDVSMSFDALLQDVRNTDGDSGYQLTIPIDKKYDGTNISILHYLESGELNYRGEKVKKDTIDRYDNVMVKNGTVVIKVNALSPFAVIVPKKAAAVTSEVVKVTSTVVQTGENTPTLYLIGAGAVMVVFMIFPVFWMIKRRRKISRGVDKQAYR